MGRVKLHLVRYMGTYTALMFVSFSCGKLRDALRGL